MPAQDLAAPGAATAAAASIQRDALVVADLARHLKRSEPLRLLGHVGVALAVLVLMRDSAPPGWLALWALLLLSHAAFNGWAAWRVWSRPTRTENAPRRLRAVLRMEAVNGLLWMAAELIILPSSDYTHRGLLKSTLKCNTASTERRPPSVS
ncbi:hypothetical protein RQP53_23895 [Paucibacter sp. APW11]|uniref:Uncharacterized protein n=1 Tax=Roseateles aquae TaxID=3077235 RepID=A0ABU3PIS4_9BURK|nr:hypothetical protein [Paucibacter sp. APW11]MDT9002345.1 hypothetical protein [Paucibacter sp. APW11]